MKKIYSLLIAITVTLKVFATDYYINNTGNNSNTGTSIANAWQTMAKINVFAWSTGFVAGDRILFEGGQTFIHPTGIYIQLDRSRGTAASPITFSSYGIGRAILKANANDVFNLWAPTTGVVGLGFKFTNLILEGDNVTKTGPVKSVAGITVWNSSSTALDYLLVEDVEIKNFAGNGFSTGRDNGSKGRLTNVVVRRVVSHNNKGALGLAGNTGSGIIIGGADGALVEDCIAYKNGINNNNAAGPVGIWVWDSINSIIQKCESHHNETTFGDGGGFDIDGASQNCIIQYCYSHDNAGAGYLLAQYSGASLIGPLANNIIRYNISENDARKKSFGAIHFWANGGADFVGATEVYNNTIFLGGTALDGAPAAITFQNTNCTGIKIRNNIFVASSNFDLVASPTGTMGISKALFQNNSYWTMPSTTFKIKWGNTTYNTLTAWQTASGQEKSGTTNLGFTIDPQLNDAGNGETINNTSLLNTLTAYKLKSTSGLINNGLNLTQPPYNLAIGIRDFYGTTIPNGGGYEIGAYEYDGTLPVSLINFSGNSTTSGNVLNWRTTSEQKNSGFEILRSINGIDFKKVGFKKSLALNGNSNSTLDYTFYDITFEENVYYKLKQIDENGKSEVSAIIIVKPAFVVENQIYPNPVTDNLNIMLVTTKKDKATVIISDQSGKVLLTVQETLQKGKNIIKLNTSNLAKGWYLLSIKNSFGSEVLTRKIIKF